MSIGWRDAWLPALLWVVGAIELSSLRTQGWTAALALEAVAAVALVFRRRWGAVAVPVSGLALMAIPLTGTQMDEPAAPILFYIVGIYSLGRHLGRYAAVLVSGLTVLLVTADLWFSNGQDWTDVMFVLSLAVPPFVFGRVARRLAEQTELVASQAEQLRDQAVRDERDRIARELHDVIAHSVSAMVVQTAAAQDLLARDPDRAAELLENVAETGRTALAETGRLLHVIRDDADELGLRPAPGLADVPVLLDQLRAGGLVVDAELDLGGVSLPGGIDVSAYRVVQEALTNALKHGAGTVRLAVDADGRRLRIHCSNPAGAGHAPGAGLGLLGIGERVAVLGGSVRHDDADGRFRLDVEIPLGASS